jgi:xanthine dehydrogenase accessory factor
VGGGALERQVIADSLVALAEGQSILKGYRLQPSDRGPATPDVGEAEADDYALTLGMLCGGEAEVFLEVYGRESHLLIVGAGHIGQKLCEMARLLDFRVTVLDERPEMVSRDRFPGASELVCAPPAEASRRVTIRPTTAVVIVTHGHVHDKAALAAVLASPARYIGMIGSKAKVRAVLEQLLAEGVDRALLERVHAPIGLDLGGQSPAEIALSILAEIVAEAYGRPGGPMKTSGLVLSGPGGAG